MSGGWSSLSRRDGLIVFGCDVCMRDGSLLELVFPSLLGLVGCNLGGILRVVTTCVTSLEKNWSSF